VNFLTNVQTASMEIYILNRLMITVVGLMGICLLFTLWFMIYLCMVVSSILANQLGLSFVCYKIFILIFSNFFLLQFDLPDKPIKLFTELILYNYPYIIQLHCTSYLHDTYTAYTCTIHYT